MVEHSRKKALDPFIIYNYFYLLWKTMVDLKIEDRTDRIWNLDETSFCLNPSKTKIVGEIGVAATRTIYFWKKEHLSFDGM